MSTASFSRPSPFAVFRRRSFVLLWLSQFGSSLAYGLSSVAVALLVYRETSSAFSVGLALIATSLPGLLVGLVAGVFVDRVNRKQVMVVADLVRALLLVLLPLLLPFGIAWIYLLTVLVSTATQFFDPAQASLLPELASDEELAAANALMNVSNVAAITVGYVLAGVFAASLDVHLAFYLAGATYLFSALCMMLLRAPQLSAEAASSVANVVQNLQAGLRFVVITPILRSLFLIYLPLSLIAGLQNALFLPFSLRALGASEFDYSLLEALFAFGLVLGSMAMVAWANRLHEGQWVALSVISSSVVDLGYALNGSSVPLAFVLITFSGMLSAPHGIGRNLIVQRNTPREARGRVISSYLVSRDAMIVVGTLIGGLADVIDVRLLLLSAAAASLAAGLVVLALPGLGQPSAEWRQLLHMLRAAPQAPGLGLGRAATLADIDLLTARLPGMSGLPGALRRDLAAQTRVYEAPTGTAVVRQGEISDMAYVLLDGRTVASRRDGESDQVLEVHNAGDFFGEIAALTGVPRTATVLAEQPTRLLGLPAATLKRLADAPALNGLFHAKMTERMVRMHLVDAPHMTGLDQATLRELRAAEPQATTSARE